MKPFKSRSTAQQLADHLRGEVLRGAFGHTMPGIKYLTRELGVNSRAAANAVKQLAKDGILVGQGERRRHRIVLENNSPAPALRIAFPPFDTASKRDSFNLEILRNLSQHGHEAFFTGKTLMELHLDPRRIAGMVGQTKADAWIVISAPRPVLDWFAGRALSSFALYGAQAGLPMAGVAPDHVPALLGVVRRLIHLGHRRIVFLLNRGQLELKTARLAPMLLAEMETHGIPTSRYNVPQWKDSPEGFRGLLESMFQHSPPTALMIEEVPHLIAVLQFCGRRGIRVPEDLSLVCLESHSILDHCSPAVTRLQWDETSLMRRIVNWANNVARGRRDVARGYVRVDLVEGGTIGPVAEKR